MLNCREFISGVTELSCGSLAAAAERDTKRHLAQCGSCASYWRSYRTAVALARRAYCLPDPETAETPEDLVNSVLLAARARRAGASGAWRLVNLLSGIAAAPLLAFCLR